jgi:ATP-binding protein involved in chromosome partitioning
MITKERILEALVRHVPKEIVSGIVLDGKRVGFALESTDENIRLVCEKAVFAIPGVEKVTAVLTAPTGRISVENKGTNALDRRQVIPGVKRVIAVAAGKGGVGKSTIAVNLALAAAAAGKKVALVDADIYGPSVPRMLGLQGKPALQDSRMVPHEKAGIQANSIGFLINEDDAAIWRGPMATKAIHQLFIGTKWDADILFIDMPPGTGDIQLSIAQNYRVDGAVIVSTPQEIALADVRKAVKMFQRVDIPILGVVENMAYFEDATGHKNFIFGQGGAKNYAAEIKAPFLGEVPLRQEIRENADRGQIAAQPIFIDIFSKLS